MSWPDLMRDLGRVQSVILDVDGQRYRLRTDCVGHAHKAFLAAGVAIPPAVTPLGLVPADEPDLLPAEPASV